MSNSKVTLQPWQKPFYNSFGIVRFHEEIIDFCNYVKPTLLEDKVRLYVVDKVKRVIQGRWPTASVNVFGSFATNLYLPTSDIDIVVIGEWEASPLWTVDKILRENDISNDIRVIEKATVPIVKFAEKETGIYVDISFNKNNGIKAIPLIRQYLSTYIHLERLFLVLKYFMLQRDLNEVWTGGIGSYSLMLLCISYLQHYNKNYSGDMNLGCLLMEFFELYGRVFNFLNTGISVKNNGFYKMKYDNNRAQKMSFISIEDPIDSEHDVARSCYGLFNIRSAFSNAYSKLCSKVVPSCLKVNNGSTELSHSDSILASIITVSSEMTEFRSRIRSKFSFLIDYKEDTRDSALPSTIKYCEDFTTMIGEKTIRKRMRYGKRRNVESQDFNKTTPRITRNVSKGIPQHVLKKLPKHVVRKYNKARNWCDLADWSQDNVFNYQQ